MKKKILIAVSGVIVLLIIVGAGFAIWITRGLSDYVDLVIEEVDLSEAADGKYEGSFEGRRWSNTVEVFLEEGKITNIEIIEDVRFKRSEVHEELFENVIREQRIDADVVSGATVTSKAYLKAIENALRDYKK